MLQKLYDLSILVDNYDAKCKLLEYKLEFCINYNDYFDEKEKRIVIDSNLII